MEYYHVFVALNRAGKVQIGEIVTTSEEMGLELIGIQKQRMKPRMTQFLKLKLHDIQPNLSQLESMKYYRRNISETILNRKLTHFLGNHTDLIFASNNESLSSCKLWEAIREASVKGGKSPLVFVINTKDDKVLFTNFFSKTGKSNILAVIVGRKVAPAIQRCDIFLNQIYLSGLYIFFCYKPLQLNKKPIKVFTNMKTESYITIVKALEALMKRAMKLKIRKEDPYGEIKTFQISGIRIAYIREEKYNLPYLNAVPGRTEIYKYAPEMLITLFYKGKEKQVDYSLSLKNGYLSTYNGILTSGWARLTAGINGLLDEFYGSTLEDKKLYLEAEVSPTPYMKDEEFELPKLEQVPKEFASDFQQMLKNYYLTATIAEVVASVSSNRKVWIVVDNCGTRVIQKQDIMRFTIDPWGVSKTKRMFTDGVYRMATSFEALKSEFPSAKKDLQKFLYTLDRKQLPSGIYPLIFDHSATATLFHEAIAGHMLSGRYIVEEDSTIFKGKLGKCVATDKSMSILKKLQIWDCPQDTSMLAHYKYDMEGIPALDTLLIDKGVVKNYLHDRNSAARMKKKPNGHALAEDFQQSIIINFFMAAEARLPEPRVSNLKVLSDSKVTFEELEAKFFKEYGYYILVKSYAGEVDVSTGTFELKVECLEKVYADGKREYFHGGVFSSNLTDFISAVKEVSNQYGITGGYCGSSSGSVPTQEYTPAMSVYGVNWVPSALPEKDKNFCISNVKYIPYGWKDTEKDTEKYEV